MSRELLISSLFLIFIALAAGQLAFAQTASPTPELYSKQTLSDLSRLQKAALDSDYAYRQTRYMTNNIGPRLSGSAQAQRAVEYVADEMRKAGFQVRLQKVMVPVWVRGSETAEVVQLPGMAAGTTQKLVITALGGSIATPSDGLSAEIVVVDSFDQLRELGRAKIEGKIVVFNHKFDRELQSGGFGLAAYGRAVQFRAGGASAAAPFGAVGVLVRSAGGSYERLAHTGGTNYAEGINKIPAAALAPEDADLLAHLASEGPTRVRFTVTPKTLPDAPSYNVIADLKGSERPNEIVLVGGHLDSWDLGTGALDNATGVAVSMQVPVLINQLGLRPKRTIRVVAFMNEENGGAGGRGYFDEVRNSLDQQFAAIESDLGASHPLGISYSGRPELAQFLAPISKILAAHGTAHLQQQPGGIGADTSLLTRAGVPSFAPFFNQQTYFKYHHSAADTFDKVNPKELAELGSLMAVLAYGLANLEQPLPR